MAERAPRGACGSSATSVRSRSPRRSLPTSSARPTGPAWSSCGPSGPACSPA